MAFSGVTTPLRSANRIVTASPSLNVLRTEVASTETLVREAHTAKGDGAFLPSAIGAAHAEAPRNFGGPSQGNTCSVAGIMVVQFIFNGRLKKAEGPQRLPP
jgi:hypothetical protein